MRHRWTGRKLGRRSKHRKAMTRNLITSVLDEERVKTTLAKAKEVRRHVERVITLGKRGTLHARRQAAAIVRTPAIVQKLMDTLGPRYAERPGGYTRIIQMPPRVGDAAPMAILELVDRDTTREEERLERRRLKQEAAGES
ncbi:MAG: 50S ribosomal protein L17 [Nitrospinaceae bacterium]|jgi:large subunit ribosomal protein L17|nr:50S ribosomal protein L17 [Nitrospinaceae bacterium]MBT3432690.1 50S ribosomal protein L17 [Nitrospinaceae bacterium]MBT3820272.1 50S ribosomal protein L17 [Nitrospinaceae bacterium]MBT4094263.1 50S ribosomal protein L17 [Nitrospinaceae bacterium]MBT4429759.1 50S ribosomal protein L17 [Nitrospinaceae bacterium]